MAIKGKTYEESYGKEKSDEIKRKLSIKSKGRISWSIGLTKEQHPSLARIAEKSKGRISNKKNKTYEEIYGINKAREIKERLKGKKSWNEGITKETNKTLKKISENMMGCKNVNYGKPLTKEQKEHLKLCFTGRIVSQKTRELLSNSQLGKNNSMYGKFGEQNPAWLGGKSFEPYTSDFNKQFKEAIKERDNYTCQLCSIFEDDHLKLHNRRLDIHHIDYDKKNTFPQNCITLCMRCNIIINKDRELWTKHFQDLLKKLYGYEYTQDQKIILDFTGDNND